jgi:hypothetical protein
MFSLEGDRIELDAGIVLAGSWRKLLKTLKTGGVSTHPKSCASASFATPARCSLNNYTEILHPVAPGRPWLAHYSEFVVQLRDPQLE